MKWYNKVFRNERNGKNTLINFDDLDHDVKVILCCCADGLLSGTNFSYEYSDVIIIDVFRFLDSYISYVNGIPFCDVPLKVISDFYFETYEEKGRFYEISGTDDEHGTVEDQDTAQDITSREEEQCKAAQISGTDSEDARTIVYYDDHHIRLTRGELELIKAALIHFGSDYKDFNLYKRLDYLLTLLDRVLGRGYDSSVVHLNDDSIPF